MKENKTTTAAPSQHTGEGVGQDELFNQIANISKAHAYDIVSEQVQELTAQRDELAATLKWVINELETTPDILQDALLGMIKIKSRQSLLKIQL